MQVQKCFVLSIKSTLQFSQFNIQKQYRLNKATLVKLSYDIEKRRDDSRSCTAGGFILEPDDGSSLRRYVRRSFLSKLPTSFYNISEKALVRKALASLDEEYLKKVVLKLSSYTNRYYRTSSGIASQKWIFEQWKGIAKSRDNVSARMIKHRSFPQPSVLLEIKGSVNPDEIVVIGGHGDSTSGWRPGEHTHAPGADDNASGIATVMSVAKSLLESGFRPKRTLQFIAYAAEEVGLRGSMDIASRYRDADKNVVGVLQLDMTNFKGSAFDIVFMQDYTDRNQNRFLEKLVRTYLPDIEISHDRCGYACSDHASWNRAGIHILPEAKFDGQLRLYQ